MCCIIWIEYSPYTTLLLITDIANTSQVILYCIVIVYMFYLPCNILTAMYHALSIQKSSSTLPFQLYKHYRVNLWHFSYKSNHQYYHRRLSQNSSAPGKQFVVSDFVNVINSSRWHDPQNPLTQTNRLLCIDFSNKALIASHLFGCQAYQICLTVYQWLS